MNKFYIKQTFRFWKKRIAKSLSIFNHVPLFAWTYVWWKLLTYVFWSWDIRDTQVQYKPVKKIKKVIGSSSTTLNLDTNMQKYFCVSPPPPLPTPWLSFKLEKNFTGFVINF